MNTALRLAFAAVALVSNLTSQQVLDTMDEPPTELVSLVVLNATADQEAAVGEALVKFADAGLALPPLVIEFSAEAELCNGHAGMYRPRSFEDPAVADKIDICNRLPQILIHELAHAWERHFATDEAREALLGRWDLESWNDHSDDWHDRGGERAADTIAYTLTIDEPTDNDIFRRYVCGFEQLTGTDLPAAVIGTDCAGFTI